MVDLIKNALFSTFLSFMTNVDYYLNLEFTSKSDNNLSIKKVVINTKMLIKTLLLF